MSSIAKGTWAKKARIWNFYVIFVEGSTQGNYNLKSLFKHMKVLMTTGDLPGQLSYSYICDKCAGEVQVEQAGAALHNILNH